MLVRMLIDGKDLCGDESNLGATSSLRFLGAVLETSGATSLAPLNRLLPYSFRKVEPALWYGGEYWKKDQS
jgi:hypothetical protein